MVKPALWKKLSREYEPENDKVIRVGDIEIYKNWKPWFANINELIGLAETIGGLPFVKLEYVRQWKEKMGREKDLGDVELIENYLQKKANLLKSQ